MLSRKAQDQAPRRQAQAACAHRFPSLAARHRANQRVASPAASTRVWLRTEDVSNVEDYRFVDVRSYDDYLEGHIPGAVHIDWARDWCQQPNADAEPPCSALCIDADTYVPVLESKGISDERPVVVYGCDADDTLAAKVWWGLMVHGHPQAMLLDGGFAEWTGAGRNEELYEPCCLKLSSETVYNAEPALQWVASPSSTQQQDSITIHVDMSQAREARLMALQVADSSRAENTTKDVLHAVLGGQGLQVDKRVVLSSSGDAGGSACVAAAALQHVGWSAWAVS